MSEKIKEKIAEKNNKNIFSAGMKIIIFLIIIIAVMQVITMLQVINNKTEIVGISEDGIPVEVTRKGNNMSNQINLEQFMRGFVGLLYNWDSDIYKENIERASLLMSNDLNKNYLEEIERNGYIEQVKEYDIVSNFTIKNVDMDNIRSYKDGYKIKVKGVKLEINDFIKRKKPLNIEIAFKTKDISKNNIWGIEVFEIKESS